MADTIYLNDYQKRLEKNKEELIADTDHEKFRKITAERLKKKYTPQSIKKEVFDSYTPSFMQIVMGVLGCGKTFYYKITDPSKDVKSALDGLTKYRALVLTVAVAKDSKEAFYMMDLAGYPVRSGRDEFDAVAKMIIEDIGKIKRDSFLLVYTYIFEYFEECGHPEYIPEKTIWGN